MSKNVLCQYWHPVATSAEVSGSPVSVRLLDEQLVLFRAGGRVVAFKDLCVHRGAALSLGWLDGDHLVCAYHGWAYDVEGACVRIPSLEPGQGIPRRAHATAYHAAERYGLVWVCLDGPRLPIPDFPEFDDPSFHTFLSGVYKWKSSAARAIENFLDVGHLNWVHPGLLAYRHNEVIAPYPVKRLSDGLYFKYDVEEPSDVFTGIVHWTYRVTIPFTIYFLRTLPHEPTKRYYLSFVASPLATKECKLYVLISRNYDFDKPDEVYRQFEYEIFEQDRRVVESQRPEELPSDLTAELHLKVPDAAGLEYRRLLAEIGVE